MGAPYLFGGTSNLVRFKLRSSSTGLGLTGLTGSSSGLIISTICDNEATATNYTAAATHIQTISTLGTFVAPSASECRFGEVDSTNHPGLYEFQFADARFAVTSAKRLVISVSGATSLLDSTYEIDLLGPNLFDAVHLGLSAIPNATAGAANGLLVAGSNAPTTFAGTSSTAGLTITGGATSTGALVLTGGSTSGAGLSVTTTSGDGFSITPTAGHAITATGNGTTKHGINATGGSTSSDGIRATGGGTGHGLNLQSGSGATGDALHCLANSTNGAGFSVTGTGNGCGAQFNGGGTGGHGIAATSGGGSIGDGFTATAASSNGNGVTFTHSGTGKDLNATTTPLTLAKTTNITGLNDIAATAIVSGGAITTSSGKVSEVALVDTLTTYSGNTVQTGDAYARLGAPAGASVSADVASIKTDTGTTIPGRLPSALTGAGNIKADAVAIGGDTSCPAHLVALGLSYVIGSVNDSSPTTGGFVGSSGLSTTVGDYNRAFLVFTSGANQGIGRAISGYTGSTTKTFSFTGGTGSSDAPFPAAPANTDSFLIIGRAANGT